MRLHLQMQKEKTRILKQTNNKTHAHTRRPRGGSGYQTARAPPRAAWAGHCGRLALNVPLFLLLGVAVDGFGGFVVGWHEVDVRVGALDVLVVFVGVVDALMSRPVVVDRDQHSDDHQNQDEHDDHDHGRIAALALVVVRRRRRGNRSLRAGPRYPRRGDRRDVLRHVPALQSADRRQICDSNMLLLALHLAGGIFVVQVRLDRLDRRPGLVRRVLRDLDAGQATLEALVLTTHDHLIHAGERLVQVVHVLPLPLALVEAVRDALVHSRHGERVPLVVACSRPCDRVGRLDGRVEDQLQFVLAEPQQEILIAVFAGDAQHVALAFLGLESNGNVDAREALDRGVCVRHVGLRVEIRAMIYTHTHEKKKTDVNSQVPRTRSTRVTPQALTMGEWTMGERTMTERRANERWPN